MDINISVFLSTDMFQITIFKSDDSFCRKFSFKADCFVSDRLVLYINDALSDVDFSCVENMIFSFESVSFTFVKSIFSISKGIAMVYPLITFQFVSLKSGQRQVFDCNF